MSSWYVVVTLLLLDLHCCRFNRLIEQPWPSDRIRAQQKGSGMAGGKANT